MRRIGVIGVQFTDELGFTRTMVPLRCEEGDWFVLDQDGCSHWNNAEEVAAFAKEMADDTDLACGIDETIAAYQDLAKIMKEQQ